MKKLSFLAFFAVVALVIPFGTVQAAQMQAEKTLTISEALSENAYLVGQEVYISATARKDLLGAGGKVTVNAPVAGDLMLGAGSINILDEVAGDVRVAGGDVTISKSIGGDLLVFGGTVVILPGATIEGDVLLVGGSVDVQGTLNGSFRVYGGEATLNGIVVGPAVIKVSETIAFGEKADFRSSLSYSAPAEATITEGAKLGDEVVFTMQDTKPQRSVAGGIFAFIGVLMIMKFIGMLTAALVVTYAFKNASLALSTGAIQKFWQMTGIGLIATVVTPIAILLLFVSVIGMYVGFLVAVLYIFALLTAGIFMCIIAGGFLSKLIKKEIQVNWVWVLAGTILVFLLPFIPVLGWVALVLLFFNSIGAVVMSLRQDAKAKMEV
ncbi:MAG: hypothetical protein V4449_01695 [Patescibacteria group bacterium]